MFFFFGKILGKALFDHIPLNICLNQSILKAILGETQEEHYADINQFKHVDFNVISHFKLV